MPGTISLSGAYCVTLLPSAPNTRRMFLKLPSSPLPAGALAISPSSDQYFHSAAGTRISALANAGLLSAVSRPLMWSPWKWEMITASTAPRSMPAAARLVWAWPTAPLLCSYCAGPSPVSITTSLEPVFTTAVLNGRGGLLLVHVERSEARGELLLLGILHVGVGDGSGAGAVGDDGHLDAADLVAIEARRLLAGRGRGSAGR